MSLGIVELVKWPDRKNSSYKDIRICLRSNDEDLFANQATYCLKSFTFYLLLLLSLC